jgi:hypothetical protein
MPATGGAKGFDMNRTSLLAGLIGAIALASAAMAGPAAAEARENLPAVVADQLDGQDVAFTMTAAKQRRLMMMQESARQQQRNARGGYGRGQGYGRGPGYGHRDGYGPRPGYGYRRSYDRY